MIKINKAGHLYIVLTIMIGLAAVNTGNNLVYIIASALLSYMLISGIFGRSNIYGVDIMLEFPDEVYAGVDVPVRVRVNNTRRFMPLFLIMAEVESQAILFPFVKAKGSESRSMNMCFQRRGRYRVGPISVSSIFPFNFFTRYRKISRFFDLTIFPKPIRCRLSQLHDRQTRFKGDISSNTPGYESEILSIRDYVLGDPPKYISWKSTAKTGRLKTKELSSIELQQVLIDFNQIDRKNLEYALSCVTHVLLRLIRSSTPVGLRIDGETYKPAVSMGHKLRMLEKLALYGMEEED